MSDAGSGEGEVIGDGPRVKFGIDHVGPFPAELRTAADALAAAVGAMEAAGCCPVLDDGLSAGNGALRVGPRLLVTKSGRRPGECSGADVVCLQHFDAEGWHAQLCADDPTQRPTSDSPLYWTALVEAPRDFAWTQAPLAALHGHVLQTERAAKTLNLPMSAEETLFSTPADRRALIDLMRRAPYPEHHAWIRRGHGFFVLGGDLESARGRTLELAQRARSAGLLPS